MRLLTLALLAGTAFTSIHANANLISSGEFIDRGAATVDTNTGLEWLDLDITWRKSVCDIMGSAANVADGGTYNCLGQSVTVQSVSYITDEGWRLATYSEFDTFFENVFDTPLSTASNTNYANASVGQEFMELLSDDSKTRLAGSDRVVIIAGINTKDSTPAIQLTQGENSTSMNSARYFWNTTNRNNLAPIMVRDHNEEVAVLVDGNGNQLTQQEAYQYELQSNPNAFNSEAVEVSAPSTIGLFSAIPLLMLWRRRQRKQAI